jgi:hypothetical protein
MVDRLRESILTAVRAKFFKPKDTRSPDDVVVQTWNEFVDIYRKRKRGSWSMPVGRVGDIHDYREMQLEYPMIQGTRTAHCVTAKVTLQVSVKEGKIALNNGPRAFSGGPEAAFEFLNEFYDIVFMRPEEEL